MRFRIPEKLDVFSVSGLTELINEAKAEYDSMFSTVDAATVTDEDLTHLEALQKFYRVDGPAGLEALKNGDKASQNRASRLDALSTSPDEPVEGEGSTEEDKPEGDPTAVTAGSVIQVKVSDIVGQNPAEKVTLPPARTTRSTLVAAAGVPNYEAGQHLTSLLDVAKAFEQRSAGHGRLSGAGTGPIMYPVAQLVRDYPDELSMDGDNTDYAKLLNVIDESRLPGGSLIASAELRYKEILAQRKPGMDAMTAAAGWCAPSETDYDICLQITTDGMADWPEVQARRGGVRHNTGIEFDTIFGTCTPGAPNPTGYFNLTEAQVAAGSPTKTCLEIPCPSFVDTRLGVTGLCLTGNILATRGYPEFTATFVRGGLAASAHQVNREQIAAVVAGSTAVNLTAFQPWATDITVVSEVLSAVEMAIVDIKYRLRLARNATLEVILPYWILAQMRADWIRRNGGNYAEMLCLADSAIMDGFTCRGARPQFVYDWQDAFATCAATGSPGADAAITNLPISLQFLVYPAGTWVRAVNDVITLNSVYDSTKLATNQVTHLFTETGWAMLQMCPVSRVYTVPICPSGRTGNQQTITCPS
jgi:hypothetical protein